MSKGKGVRMASNFWTNPAYHGFKSWVGKNLVFF